jgi:hypothetical protein
VALPDDDPANIRSPVGARIERPRESRQRQELSLEKQTDDLEVEPVGLCLVTVDANQFSVFDVVRARNNVDHRRTATQIPKDLLKA